MDPQPLTKVPARARVAAGLSLASYVLAHPVHCWEWLRDTSVAQRLRLLEYGGTLILLSAAAGILRSITFGVYIPLYGAWRMPVLDAITYYVVIVAWALAMLLAGTSLLKALGKAYGSIESHDPVWMGLLAFSATPFLLSGLFVIVPSQTLRSICALTGLYGVVLFWMGVTRLSLVVPERRVAFSVHSIGSIVLLGYLSLLLLTSIFVPSYPARLISEPVLSRDVLDFKITLEQLVSQS